MKKLNNELQESNLFESLQVFENNEINKAVDRVYQLLEENFGIIGDNVCVCGSVAKMMHGILPDDYGVKDVDLLIKNQYFYRFLKVNIHRLKIDFRIDEHKIILFYPFICLELWEHNPSETGLRTEGIFEQKIKYSIYNG